MQMYYLSFCSHLKIQMKTVVDGFFIQATSVDACQPFSVTGEAK